MLQLLEQETRSLPAATLRVSVPEPERSAYGDFLSDLLRPATDLSVSENASAEASQDTECAPSKSTQNASLRVNKNRKRDVAANRQHQRKFRASKKV